MMSTLVVSLPTPLASQTASRPKWVGPLSEVGVVYFQRGRGPKEKSLKTFVERGPWLRLQRETERLVGRSFGKEEALVGVLLGDCGDVGPSGPSNRSSRFVLHECI